MAIRAPDGANKVYDFQNECATSRPLLYCALKAKSYCILTEDSLADLKKKINMLERQEGSEGRLYTQMLPFLPRSKNCNFLVESCIWSQ